MDLELSTGKLVKKSGERKSKRQVTVRDRSLHWASGKGRVLLPHLEKLLDPEELAEQARVSCEEAMW